MLAGWPAHGAAPGPAGGAALGAEHALALQGAGVVCEPAGARQSAESQQACSADGRPSADRAPGLGSAMQPRGEPAVAADGQVHGNSTASPAPGVKRGQHQAGAAAQPGFGPAQGGHAHETWQAGARLGSASAAAAARLLTPRALQACTPHCRRA